MNRHQLPLEPWRYPHRDSSPAEGPSSPQFLWNCFPEGSGRGLASRAHSPVALLLPAPLLHPPPAAARFLWMGTGGLKSPEKTNPGVNLRGQGRRGSWRKGLSHLA